MGSGLSSRYDNTIGSGFVPSLQLREQAPEHNSDSHTIQYVMKQKTEMADNLQEADNEFVFNTRTGYYGKAGTNSKTRELDCDQPIESARRLYELLSQGGQAKLLNGGKGEVTKFVDGSVTYREHSKSGGPAVDIIVKTKMPIKSQKIHFRKKDNGNN